MGTQLHRRPQRKMFHHHHPRLPQAAMLRLFAHHRHLHLVARVGVTETFHLHLDSELKVLQFSLSLAVGYLSHLRMLCCGWHSEGREGSACSY